MRLLFIGLLLLPMFSYADGQQGEQVANVIGDDDPQMDSKVGGQVGTGGSDVGGKLNAHVGGKLGKQDDDEFGGTDHSALGGAPADGVGGVAEGEADGVGGYGYIPDGVGGMGGEPDGVGGNGED